MNKFESYDKLLKEIGMESTLDFTYAKNELRNWLESIEADYGNEEPSCLFSLEFNDIRYNIGVTYTKDKEDKETYIYTYWIIDIDNLENKKWKDVKHVLNKHITIDMGNFDKMTGIVDFDSIYFYHHLPLSLQCRYTFLLNLYLL